MQVRSGYLLVLGTPKTCTCQHLQRVNLVENTIYCGRQKTLFDCDIQKILGALRRSVDSTYSESIAPYHIRSMDIDVNRSEIALSHMDDGESATAKIDELGILISNKGAITENLPFETVSNSIIPGPPGSTVVMRRCGGRLLSLNPGQEGELEGFVPGHVKMWCREK